MINVANKVQSIKIICIIDFGLNFGFLLGKLGGVDWTDILDFLHELLRGVTNLS